MLPKPWPLEEPDVHVEVNDFRLGEASGRAGGDGRSVRDPGAPHLTLYSAAFHRADHLIERASTVHTDLQFPSNHAGYICNRRHPVARKRLTKQRNGLEVWGPFENFVCCVMQRVGSEQGKPPRTRCRTACSGGKAGDSWKSWDGAPLAAPSAQIPSRYPTSA